MGDVNKKELPVATRLLADAMKPLMKPNTDVVSDDDIVEKTWSEGRPTIQQHRDVQADRNLVQGALETAFGEVSVDHMKGNPDVKEMTGEFKIGNDKISIQVRREHSFRKPGAGADEPPVVIRGHMTSGYDSHRSKAEAKEIRKAVSVYAAANLND